MYTPDFFHNIRCLKKKTLSHKQFFLYSILCISSLVEMNDLSFSSSSPTLLCDIYQKAHSWKVFLCRKNPPNSPLVHTKSKWKKEWPQWGKWGGSWREMIDRDIYMCVCEAKLEQKKVEYLCCSFECILFSFLLLSSI